MALRSTRRTLTSGRREIPPLENTVLNEPDGFVATEAEEAPAWAY
jgi:hypothetical protein